MAFVSETISEADAVKYGLDAIDKRYVEGGTTARDWTIDRERNIYLRTLANGQAGCRSRSLWTFYWRGQLMVLDLHLLGGGGLRGQPGWSHWRVHKFYLPSHLDMMRNEILTDLRDALTAYKDAGVWSENTTYRVILSF